MIYLAVDTEFCGTNSNYHSIFLANTTLFNPNRGAGELSIGTAPVYDGSYDLIATSADNAGPLRYKKTFALALLLNYTAYANSNKRSFLTSLRIAGSPPNVSVGGGAVLLYMSNPSRKRVHVTEPWFDYGYWTKSTFSDSPTENEIPMWLVDMREAARGRRSGRICAPDYSLEIGISSPWFQLDPLFIREYAGTKVALCNISLRNNIILDLSPHVRNKKLELTLTHVDVAYLYLNKPPRALLVNYTDKGSFIGVVLPFVQAPSKTFCRTITMSFGTARYMCPSVMLDPQAVVDIELISEGFLASETLCQDEQDGSITVFALEPTLSRILLIIRPLGRGRCTCMGTDGAKQCAAS